MWDLYLKETLMAKDLTILSDFYDLMKYMTERIEKFPRHHRYSLGLSMENRLQQILGALIRAKYTGAHESKRLLLADVNIELEVLRYQARLALECRCLAPNSHAHAAKLLEWVGAQVGGWLRSLRSPSNP
ncbi:MAG: diversity-generating retroelement protein Avd [Planctomycetes bacterium]|nr:diversity-generating retroelement protein Avd [Planctomycetota bacterium]